MIEAKGLFTATDRKKHIFIKQQHPELDIRFVFMSATNKLSKKSRTTYADWADKNDFKWANKTIPESWLKESKPTAELNLIIDILKGFKNK